MYKFYCGFIFLFVVMFFAAVDVKINMTEEQAFANKNQECSDPAPVGPGPAVVIYNGSKGE